MPMIAIVAIFYFLVFMPMQKQKKEQAAMLAALAAGNEVVTSGGIVGTIVSLSDGSLALVLSPGTDSRTPKVLIYDPAVAKADAPVVDLGETAEIGRAHV